MELGGHECLIHIIKMAQAYREGVESGPESRDAAIGRAKSCRDAAVRDYERIVAVLETRPEFSLRLDVDAMLSVPGTNPYTETAVKRTAHNFYMRNTILELYRQVYLPEFQALAGLMLDRLALGEKEPIGPDDEELTARFVKIGQDFLAAPMPEYVRPERSTTDAVGVMLVQERV